MDGGRSRKRRPAEQQDFFSQSYGMKDTIRFVFEPKVRQEKDLRFLYKEILFKVFGLEREDFFCVQEFSSRGTVDVTLQSLSLCEKAYALYKGNARDPVFVGVQVYPLFSFQEKLVTVHIYNPFVSRQEVEAFLYQFCEKVTFQADCRDILGSWNGKRKFKVLFKKDPDGEGGIMRPPPVIYISRCRGYLFYAGMPPYCKTCKKNGHSEETCEKNRQPSKENQETETEQGKEAEQEKETHVNEPEGTVDENVAQEEEVVQEEEVDRGKSSEAGREEEVPQEDVVEETPVIKENLVEGEVPMEMEQKKLKRSANREEGGRENKLRVVSGESIIPDISSLSEGEDLHISTDQSDVDEGGGSSPGVNILRNN